MEYERGDRDKDMPDLQWGKTYVRSFFFSFTNRSYRTEVSQWGETHSLPPEEATLVGEDCDGEPTWDWDWARQ